MDNGIPVPSLTLGNLGNIDKTADSVVISRYITVNDEEAAVLEQLHEKGVRLEAKLQPADDAIADFYQVMKDKRKS